MSDPAAYQWSFERSDFEADPRFSTFSVGIFQWLPKSNGRGLKKSKTIRILGYTAEPAKVYEKAAELCRRLNESHANAEAPPPWLQKQYSVPKPAGMELPKHSSRLTGQQVRGLRRQVMKEELLPLQFVDAGEGVYVRRCGEQIHLIHFQASKYGDSFTVNLGFHYTFVPPQSQMRAIALSEFQLLDCALGERLGFFLPERRDMWFEYGADREALRGILQKCAAESLIIVDEAAEQWADPAELLAKLMSAPEGVWDCHNRDLLIACIAMRLGRPDEAEPRLRRCIAECRVHAHKPALEELLQRLNRMRAGEAGALKDWIT